DGAAQGPRQLHGIIIRPKVHIEEPWLVVQRMTVQCHWLNSVVFQNLDYWANLLPDHREIPGNCSVSIACGLKIDYRPGSHGRWRLHSFFGELRSTRGTVVQHASAHVALATHDLIQSGHIQP